MISRRYKVVFAALRPFLKLYLRIFYNYRARQFSGLAQGQPAIILSNHNCNLDPFMIAVSFNMPIFYVASDHIFRLGLVSRIISFLVAPIPIVKSHIDLRTLRKIREIMSDGGVVGLFPEGNRSFNGRTGWISPATGKLVRQLKSTLVIYHIDGGYMTTPRWARTRRRGKMAGRVVKVYRPDELASMTPEQIQQEIEANLAVDAYEQQLQEPVAFKGSNLAENLELTLFVCPKCHRLASLKSKESEFFCSCGLRVKIDNLGFFEPVDSWSKVRHQSGSMLLTVADWDDWQRKYLVQIISDEQAPKSSADEDNLLFQDERQQLIKLERAVKSSILANGNLRLYSDRLVFIGEEERWHFKLEDIARMTVHGRMTLQFATADGSTYEVRTGIIRSAYKYVILFNLLQLKRKGAPYGFFGI